jgi:hypothetical protein
MSTASPPSLVGRAGRMTRGTGSAPGPPGSARGCRAKARTLEDTPRRRAGVARATARRASRCVRIRGAVRDKGGIRGAPHRGIHASERGRVVQRCGRLWALATLRARARSGRGQSRPRLPSPRTHGMPGALRAKAAVRGGSGVGGTMGPAENKLTKGGSVRGLYFAPRSTDVGWGKVKFQSTRLHNPRSCIVLFYQSAAWSEMCLGGCARRFPSSNSLQSCLRSPLANSRTRREKGAQRSS